MTLPKSSEFANKYGNARVLCITPCLKDFLPEIATKGLTIPGLSTRVKPMLDFKMEGSCDQCEVVFNLLLQIKPFFLSLSLPLCLVTCAIKLIEFLKSMKNFISDMPTPNPTDPLKKAAMAVIKCQECVTGWSPGKFCAALRDIMDLIIALLRCIKTILTKIVSMNLRVAGLLMDPDISIQRAGVCLGNLVKSDMDKLNARIDMIAILFKTLEFLFAFVSGVTSEEVNFTEIQENFSELTKPGTPIGDVIAGLDAIISLLLVPRNIFHQCAIELD